MRFTLIATAALAASAAAANPAYDGPWRLEIVTTCGNCDALSRYYVEIADGNIHMHTMSGQPHPEPAGRVGESGRVSGVFGSRADPVKVHGRLSARLGSGAWEAPAQGCEGRWSAFRRS